MGDHGHLNTLVNELRTLISSVGRKAPDGAELYKLYQQHASEHPLLQRPWISRKLAQLGKSDPTWRVCSAVLTSAIERLREIDVRLSYRQQNAAAVAARWEANRTKSEMTAALGRLPGFAQDGVAAAKHVSFGVLVFDERLHHNLERGALSGWRVSDMQMVRLPLADAPSLEQIPASESQSAIARWQAWKTKRERYTVCHACHGHIDSLTSPLCVRCGWIACQCGGCGCNWPGRSRLSGGPIDIGL